MRSRHFALIMLAVGLLHREGRASPGDDAGVSIQFELDDERVYVPVRGPPGSPEAWFVLDTGVNATIIDTAVARAWGLKARSTMQSSGAGRGTIELGLLDAQHLEVGGVAFDAEAVRVAPLEKVLGPTSGHGVGGLIGAEFFAAHQLSFDFERTVLTVKPPGSTAQGTRVPLEMRGGLPYAKAELIWWDGRRIPVDLLVDLGAKFNLLLGEAFVERIDAGVPPPEAYVASLGAGVGGRTRFRIANLQRLTLVDAPTITWAPLTTGLSVEQSLRMSGIDGLLGLSLLRSGRLTIDESAEALWLDPTSVPLVSLGPDLSGLFLTRESPRGPIVVDEVREPSPAKRAGIRVGDTLEAINGVPVTQHSLGVVREQLRNTGVAALSLRRAGKGYARTLRLEPLLAVKSH